MIIEFEIKLFIARIKQDSSYEQLFSYQTSEVSLQVKTLGSLDKLFYFNFK